MIRRGGAIALVLLLAGCGGGSTLTAGGSTSPTTSPGPSATGPGTTVPSPTVSGPAASAEPQGDRSASILPSVEMTDVARGTTVDLASLIPAQRPVLLWFWAPH